MGDTIGHNNELRESQIINSPANELTKVEYISMTLLNGLLSNPEWSKYGQIDSGELTDKAVEMAKLLLKKINS